MCGPLGSRPPQTSLRARSKETKVYAVLPLAKEPQDGKPLSALDSCQPHDETDEKRRKGRSSSRRWLMM
jgi:hypothetical protein